MFGTGCELFFDKGLVDHHLGCDIGEVNWLPRLHLLAHQFEGSLHRSTPTEMLSLSENALEWFASTRVKRP